MDFSSLLSLATQQGWKAERDLPLSGYTSFKVGGPADLLITVPDGAAAGLLLTACKKAQIPAFLLGNGSNLLVGDKGVRGVTWRFDPAVSTARLAEDGTVICDAGMPLVRLCRFAQEHALSGLEFAFGIPGSVGGAAFMNAGAYDGQMADVLQTATVIDADGASREVSADELAFGYRHSALMDTGEVVSRVTLRLHPAEKAAITEKMTALIARRREKQPLEYPSAGSFFKRPTGQYAGALIEQCGLKGFAVGGAAVSEKHAGFIVNTGGATAADIRALAEAVIARVKATTGVTLQPEVRFIGEF